MAKPVHSQTGSRLRVVASLVLWFVSGSFLLAADVPKPDLFKLPPPATNQVEFARDIRPIFENSCYQCHGPDKRKNNFRLDQKAVALRGGESGQAILPGRSSDSPLIHNVARLVKDREMPPEGKGELLTPNQIGLLRAWIDQGADWPDELSTLNLQPSTNLHWAFQTPVRPTVPQITNPKSKIKNSIDAFVLARLEKEKLAPSPEADRATLIRRLSFDLIGLPPSPQEVAVFLADQESDAYQKLVERLLASPHYGERWGRHWLDVAGYADSNGYFNADSDRPLAYKYRDWVIKAFNDDKPFDRFVREQIAGDEIAGYGPEADVAPEVAELLTATHFLRNGPDGTGESDGNPLEVATDRYAVLEGNVQILGSAFLGVTVQCARCHDHKFEPVTQEEYYQLQAILRPVYDHDKWLKPNERLVTTGTRAEREENRRQIEKSEREIKTLQESLEGLINPFRKLARTENLERVAESERAKINEALEKKEKDRSEEMKQLLKKHEALVQIKDEELAKRFPELGAGYPTLKDALKQREAAKPQPLAKIAAVIEVTPEPSPHQLLARGNYAKPARPVEPGVPAIFCSANNRYAVNVSAGPQTNGTNTARPASSGRRLALARWLTSPENPVVSRLFVNRVWLHHFGQGLVATPENFGVTGAKPTHPELLDWLAVAFITPANPQPSSLNPRPGLGWSVKALHRLIVTSATYRQSSVTSDERFPSPPGGQDAQSERLNPPLTPPRRGTIADEHQEAPLPGGAGGGFMTAMEVDPDNHLLWRFPLKRLEAETVRDAMLAVSGELDLRLGGPYVPTKHNADGQVVVDETNPGAKRRSLYLQQRRTQPLTLMEVFDGAQQNPNCTRRNPSTVSLQSLALLNSDFARARSRAFARRIVQEVDSAKRAPLAFQLALGREPKAAEALAAQEFLQTQANYYSSKPNIDESAWADFCQMLLASNAFLYVE